MPCAAASTSVRRAAVEANIELGLMDTWSPLDLVSVSDVAPLRHLVVNSEYPLQLWTANGLASVHKEFGLPSLLFRRT
jgi:hypothetical protein